MHGAKLYWKSLYNSPILPYRALSSLTFPSTQVPLFHCHTPMSLRILIWFQIISGKRVVVWKLPNVEWYRPCWDLASHALELIFSGLGEHNYTSISSPATPTPQPWGNKPGPNSHKKKARRTDHSGSRPDFPRPTANQHRKWWIPMRGTNDIESPEDNGSRTTVVSTAIDNNDVNDISNDGNGNNGGKADRIKRSNWRRSG